MAARSGSTRSSKSRKGRAPAPSHLDLGIDLGTTRTVVARADRGNYPVLSFTDTNGDSHDYYPSLTALTENGLVHGFRARRAARARGVGLVEPASHAFLAAGVVVRGAGGVVAVGLVVGFVVGPGAHDHSVSGEARAARGTCGARKRRGPIVPQVAPGPQNPCRLCASRPRGRGRILRTRNKT